jgi:phosphate acetyltransferase
MAVAHSVDCAALLGATHPAQEGLIIPVLVGLEDRIRSVAAAHDLPHYRFVSGPYRTQPGGREGGLGSPAAVDTLMKGSLHSDELMQAAVARARREHEADQP